MPLSRISLEPSYFDPRSQTTLARVHAVSPVIPIVSPDSLLFSRAPAVLALEAVQIRGE
jgi:hypothetical protein